MHRRNLLAALLVLAALPVTAATQQPQVLVILDCSYSMNRSVNLAGVPTNWLDVSRDALSRQLDKVAQAKGSAGMMLFGHRVGWKAGTMTMLRQTDWGNKIPVNVMPYEDVELIHPPGVFGPKEHLALSRLLRTARPWGETPQYLALISAAGHLKKGDRILLITDGVNNVYQPPNGKNPTANDVLKTVQGAGLRLDVVALDSDPQLDWSDLSNVAQATGGKFSAIRDAGKVGDAISASFK